MLKNDFRQSAGYIDFMRKSGWIIKEYIINNNKQYVSIWKIPYTFLSIIRLHRFTEPFLLEIVEKLINKYRVISIRVEPKILLTNKSNIIGLLKKFNYSPSNWSHNPTKTRIISIDDYEKGLKPKTKYNIRLAKKRGALIYNFNGFQVLANKKLFQSIYAILVENDKRIKLPIYPKKWFYNLLHCFNKNCLITTSFIDKKIVGFTLFIINQDAIYYTLNGSTFIGRKNFAPSLIINKTIQLAKNKKISFLDFDGVYDKRLHNSTYLWKGFTKFKESFGGKPIYLIPAYEKKISYNNNYWIRLIKKVYFPQYLPSIYPEPFNF